MNAVKPQELKASLFTGSFLVTFHKCLETEAPGHNKYKFPGVIEVIGLLPVKETW